MDLPKFRIGDICQITNNGHYVLPNPRPIINIKPENGNWLYYIPSVIDGIPECNIELISGVPQVGWHLFNLKDAYKERPPTKWAIDGLFKLPSLSIVYGSPGSMKTMILMDMAACVSCGSNWLSPQENRAEPRKTQQGPILWVDFDNGSNEMHARVEAIGRGYNLSDDIPFYYISMPDPWLVASRWDDRSFSILIDMAKRIEPCLLIIDNLGDVADVDENSAQMARVMSNFRRLADISGSAVVLIHHQRKANGLAGRKGDTLRGHSSIEAALDLALLVEREDNSDTIKMVGTKVRGPDVFPFGAVFSFEHKEGTRDLAKARFYGVLLEDTSSNTAIERVIYDVLCSSIELNKAQLTEKVKESLPQVGVNRIWTVIDKMHENGDLVQKAGSRNSKLYSLPIDPLNELLNNR